MWQLKSGDTWGQLYKTNSSNFKPNVINIGCWRPRDGPTLDDTLFPHVVHGFRGRSLPMVTFHVSTFNEHTIILISNLEIFHFPY